MSKAAFIVFCHILLLGLGAVTILDRAPPSGVSPVSNGSSGPDPDIVAFLQLAATEEQGQRETLRTLLTQAQEGLRKRDALLASGDARNREALATLQRTETEARQLAESRDVLEKQAALLESQVATQQTSLLVLEQRGQTLQGQVGVLQRENSTLRSRSQQLEQNYEAERAQVSRLEQQVAVAVSEAKVSAEVMSALQEDLRKQVAFSGQLQEQMQGSRKPTLTKEKRPARETPLEVSLNQGEQLKFDQQAPGLLNSSPAATPPASASPVFRSNERAGDAVGLESLLGQLNANRVQITFQIKRSGVFRQTVRKESNTKPILVTHAGFVLALFHIEDTPLVLEPSPAEWEGLTGTLGREPTLFAITQLSFLDRDPRIVVVPVGQAQAAQLGLKTYPTAAQPSRFDEAILLGNARAYFGEVKLQPDPAHPRYVRVPRDRFGLVSSKFSPARGDLLTTRSGELLGMMVNKEFALLLDDLACTRVLQTGATFPQSAPLLTEMYQQLTALPHRFQ